MLVLSRKPGERVLIGNDVAITIVRIGPNNVRIGFDAPRTMAIVREELGGGGESPHTAPLEPDGGPRGEPVFGGTERVAPDLNVLGITLR